MIHCRNCIHWIDESLNEIEARADGPVPVFMGCRFYGLSREATELEDCPHYVESADLDCLRIGKR